jgi:SAM-dependent methyltransferase
VKPGYPLAFAEEYQSYPATLLRDRRLGLLGTPTAHRHHVFPRGTAHCRRVDRRTPRAIDSDGQRPPLRARRRGRIRLRSVDRAQAPVVDAAQGPAPGSNLSHYPDAIDESVLAEPSEPMADRLKKRRSKLGRSARIVVAPAEALPFEDGSFDTVVSTLVLCTVTDPERALAEVRRVLRPNDRLLFCEHVRSDSRLSRVGRTCWKTRGSRSRTDAGATARRSRRSRRNWSSRRSSAPTGEACHPWFIRWSSAKQRVERSKSAASPGRSEFRHQGQLRYSGVELCSLRASR